MTFLRIFAAPFLLLLAPVSLPGGQMSQTVEGHFNVPTAWDEDIAKGALLLTVFRGKGSLVGGSTAFVLRAKIAATPSSEPVIWAPLVLLKEARLHAMKAQIIEVNGRNRWRPSVMWLERIAFGDQVADLGSLAVAHGPVAIYSHAPGTTSHPTALHCAPIVLSSTPAEWKIAWNAPCSSGFAIASIAVDLGLGADSVGIRRMFTAPLLLLLRPLRKPRKEVKLAVPKDRLWQEASNGCDTKVALLLAALKRKRSIFSGTAT